jgi:hypothetical protein
VTNASLWSMFRLIALAIFAIPVCAQNTANPYDLAGDIDSHNVAWASIWKKLGVTKPPDMPRCEVDWQCLADVVTVLNPSQAILVVVAKPENVYLRFIADGVGWRYAGHHISVKKNFGERYQISRMLGKTFLRVSSQGANGGDIDSEVESWFDLSLPDFEPVFEFTVQGSEIRFGVGVSRWVHATAAAAAESIEVDLEVRYSEALDVDLGFARYKATYARAADQKKFSLREVHPFFSDAPEISNKDFEDMASIDGATTNEHPTNERLLIYTLPRLKEIASGPDSEVKEWLRDILSVCKDTPEKRTLQALLERKR